MRFFAQSTLIILGICAFGCGGSAEQDDAGASGGSIVGGWTKLGSYMVDNYTRKRVAVIMSSWSFDEDGNFSMEFGTFYRNQSFETNLKHSGTYFTEGNKLTIQIEESHNTLNLPPSRGVHQGTFTRSGDTLTIDGFKIGGNATFSETVKIKFDE